MWVAEWTAFYAWYAAVQSGVEWKKMYSVEWLGHSIMFAAAFRGLEWLYKAAWVELKANISLMEQKLKLTTQLAVDWTAFAALGLQQQWILFEPGEWTTELILQAFAMAAAMKWASQGVLRFKRKPWTKDIIVDEGPIKPGTIKPKPIKPENNLDDLIDKLNPKNNTYKIKERPSIPEGQNMVIYKGKTKPSKYTFNKKGEAVYIKWRNKIESTLHQLNWRWEIIVRNHEWKFFNIEWKELKHISDKSSLQPIKAERYINRNNPKEIYIKTADWKIINPQWKVDRYGTFNNKEVDLNKRFQKIEKNRWVKAINKHWQEKIVDKSPIMKESKYTTIFQNSNWTTYWVTKQGKYFNISEWWKALKTIPKNLKIIREN